MTTVRFQRLESGKGTVGTIDEPGLPPVNLPAYQTAEAAGMDLYAAQAVSIPSGAMRRVSTGFNVKIPAGFEGQVRSRSGMAFKHLCVVLNAPGTIDSDYTGELFVMLVNHGEKRMTIDRNDRVAQLVVSPVVRAKVEEIDYMPTTARGAGGFGSTGGMPAHTTDVQRLPTRALSLEEMEHLYNKGEGLRYPFEGTVENARARTDHHLYSLMGAGRHAGECLPAVTDHPHVPEGCALLCSPGVEPVVVRVNRVRPFLTVEQVAKIEAESAVFNRRVWEPFMERFRSLPEADQISLLAELKEKSEIARGLPENQALVAEAMESPFGGCSIGQEGK